MFESKGSFGRIAAFLRHNNILTETAAALTGCAEKTQVITRILSANVTLKTIVAVNRGIDNYGVEGKNCLMIDVDDADAAVDSILSLLGDADKRKALTEAGLKTAQGFGWDKIAAGHAKVYQRILDA